MEIKLNLIPPSRKEKIKKLYLLRLLTRWQVEIFLMLLIFLALLWHLDYVLKIEATSNLRQIEMSRQSFSYKDMQDYGEKIKTANAQVEQLGKIQKGQLYWSVILEKLNQIIFSGIKIDNLSTKNYQVFLTGVADNRDDLVNFKEKLTEESCFTEVDFPLANLMNKEQAVFQMQFMVKEECLKIIR
ncbi:PilN domain-containing protein [Patescibacteria group bacterium]|nr:PilN domain-containing protein [Patescibacteria group bacterium]MBU2214273.1 PilN domain-containing protein [Patescibacteria group bacterium]